MPKQFPERSGSLTLSEGKIDIFPISEGLTAGRKCNIYLCMRTPIDMPDGLMQKVKAVSVARKTSFRALVIEALEKSLGQNESAFVLPDASAGKTKKIGGVSADQINRELDQQREGSFRA